MTTAKVTLELELPGESRPSKSGKADVWMYQVVRFKHPVNGAPIKCQITCLSDKGAGTQGAVTLKA